MATTWRAAARLLARRRSWCGIGVCALVAVAGAVVAYAPMTSGPAAPPARELSSKETILLEHAEQLLIGRCMRAHGFAYVAAPPPSAPVRDQRVFPYGIDDVTWAQAHGFGGMAPQGAAQSQRANPNSRYVASLPERQQDAYLVTLQGTPHESVSVTLPTGYTVLASTRGCIAAARDQLYGDFPRWFRASTIVNHLSAEIQRSVLDDPRYRRGLVAWSACMRGSGHPAASPWQLRAQHVERFGQDGGASARDLERALAVAEAHCMRQTGLAEVARDLERHFTGEVRQLRRAEIHAVRALQIAALGRAREVLAPDR